MLGAWGSLLLLLLLLLRRPCCWYACVLLLLLLLYARAAGPAVLSHSSYPFSQLTHRPRLPRYVIPIEVVQHFLEDLRRSGRYVTVPLLLCPPLRPCAAAITTTTATAITQ
jgi:hypothetical protein